MNLFLDNFATQLGRIAGATELDWVTDVNKLPGHTHILRLGLGFIADAQTSPAFVRLSWFGIRNEPLTGIETDRQKSLKLIADHIGYPDSRYQPISFPKVQTDNPLRFQAPNSTLLVVRLLGGPWTFDSPRAALLSEKQNKVFDHISGWEPGSATAASIVKSAAPVSCISFAAKNNYGPTSGAKGDKFFFCVSMGIKDAFIPVIIDPDGTNTGGNNP